MMNRNEDSASQIRKKRQLFCRRMLLGQLPASLVVALSMSFSDMADALVLGNRIGEIGLAAIALATPVFMIMNIIIQGFGPGGSIRYATLMAEGDEEEALSIYKSSIIYSLLAGAIIALFVNAGMKLVLGIQGINLASTELYIAASSYLRIISLGAPVIIVSFVINDFMRNEDMEKIAGVGASVGNILDILLNVLLVLLLRMGITGCAIATVLGKTVSLLIYLAAIYKNNSNLRLAAGNPKFAHIGRCFRTGASTAVQYLSDMIFFLMVNSILMRMAGQAGIAIFDIIQNVSYILMYLYLAFAEAGQPAVSTYTGEQNSEARRFLKKSMFLWGEISVGIIAILIFVFAPYICRVFGLHDSEVVFLGAYSIRLYILGAPFMGASLILGGYYQACDNTRCSYLIASLRGIIILLPVTIAMSRAGLEYFFLLYPVTESISIIVFLIYSRYRSLEDITFDEKRVCRYTIENDTKQLTDCCVKVETFCESFDVNPRKQFLVQMAIEELVAAIMNYGFTSEDGMCEVTVIITENGNCKLHIRDNAVTFNPLAVARKGSGINEEELNLLCIDMIKKSAESFSYRRYQGFNTLVVNL